MKTRKFYYFLVAILALNISMVACSGDDGEIGPNGLKGEQGVQGEVGPAGADGSIIYSGEGEPAADTGIKGDYYCDSSTGMLYGPKKENASWEGSDSFSLKGQNGTNGTDGQDGTNGTDGQDGADGSNGTDGSKTLSGTGLPANTIGNTGDFYLDKETYTLYGPKAKLVPMGETLWGMGLLLKGAEGNANVRTFKLTVGLSDWDVVNNTAEHDIKYGSYITTFPALNKDLHDNGIILVYRKRGSTLSPLPLVDFTPNKNILKQEYTIYLYNPTTQLYRFRITKKLQAFSDLTELLSFDTEFYHIKLITGQTAVNLNANKNNEIEFNRLVGELAK